MDYQAYKFYNETKSVLRIDFTPSAIKTVDGGKWETFTPTQRGPIVLPSGDLYSWHAGSNLARRLERIEFDIVFSGYSAQLAALTHQQWQSHTGKYGYLQRRTRASGTVTELLCWLWRVELIEEWRNDDGDGRRVRFEFEPYGTWA